MTSPKTTNPKDLASMAKLPAAILPPVARVLCAAVLRKGAELYGAANWRKDPVKRSVYDNAMERHILKYQSGELLDEKTKLPHLAHIATNCMILLDAEAAGTLIEDAPYAGVPVTQLINDLTKGPEGSVVGNYVARPPQMPSAIPADLDTLTGDVSIEKPNDYLGWAAGASSSYVIAISLKDSVDVVHVIAYARQQQKHYGMSKLVWSDGTEIG